MFYDLLNVNIGFLFITELILSVIQIGKFSNVCKAVKVIKNSISIVSFASKKIE